MKLPVVRALAVLLLFACGDSPAEPNHESYVLATINAQPLPGPYPDPLGCCTHFEVTAGTLLLRADGTFREAITVRCRNPLPPGSSCQISGTDEHSMEGIYSRTEGYLDYAGGDVQLDNRFPAAFADGSITVDIGYPPSQGFFPRFILHYRR